MERHTSDLDATIDALHGGIMAISPSAAVSTIDGWQAQLQSANQPELQAIANDLGELKRQLTSGDLNGRAIGQLLTRLAERTSAAAGSADGAKQGKLQQLAQLLSKAGRSLS